MMMTIQPDMPRQCVLVFLKWPEKGKVKTRLSEDLDETIVLNLYRYFVADTLNMLRQAGYQTVVCYHPPEAVPQVRDWLGGEFVLWPQTGSDLGEKMANAFVQAFSKGYEQVLLMGTDLPGLPPAVIREAFEKLSLSSAAIGPAPDGGYYLIGFSSAGFTPDAFSGICWSTETVFEDSLAVMKKNGLVPHILPRWRDIDDHHDLTAFMADCDPASAPHTFAYLSAIGLC